MGENRFLDDLAKFGNNTLTAFSGMQRQVRKWVIEQVEAMIESADLVTKEQMNSQINSYQQKIQDLENRIEQLEKATESKIVSIKKQTRKAS